MNKQIRGVSLLAGLMFLALMANLTGSAIFRQASLNNDPRNVRVRDAEFSQNRGDILVGSMPIASTPPGRSTLPSPGTTPTTTGVPCSSRPRMPS